MENIKLLITKTLAVISFVLGMVFFLEIISYFIGTIVSPENFLFYYLIPLSLYNQYNFFIFGVSGFLAMVTGIVSIILMRSETSFKQKKLRLLALTGTIGGILEIVFVIGFFILLFVAWGPALGS